MHILLIAAATLSGLASIASDLGGVRRPLFYLAKPLTTLLILALAWYSPTAATPYSPWLMAALLCCLGGDIALMFSSSKAFVQGLASFLIGHLLLIVAFATDMPLTPLFLPPAVLIAASAFTLLVVGFAGRLLPLAGRLKLPLMLYVSALAVMVLVALLRATLSGTSAAWWVCVGALLFAVSDAVLGYRKFVATPRWGQPVTLLSYYLAIGLIAWAY